MSSDNFLKVLQADQLAMRMCVVQLIVDQMREQPNLKAMHDKLRTFDNDVQGLLSATVEGRATAGSDVQMLAVERLGKLMEIVRALVDQK